MERLNGLTNSYLQDVNNDGYDDVIIGESPELTTTAGAAYVVFGSESFSALELDVSALDGTNGFKIEGSDAGDYAGSAVAGAGVSGGFVLRCLHSSVCPRAAVAAAAAIEETQGESGTVYLHPIGKGPNCSTTSSAYIMFPFDLLQLRTKLGM